MSNHNYYYRDDDYNPEQSAAYTLLVQVGMASLSYAVIGHQKLLVIEEDLALSTLTEPSEANKLLSAEYGQRIIGLQQSGFTFVPAGLFKPELLADFARFLDVKANEKVFHQQLDDKNYVIYKVDESIVATVSNKYGIRDAVFGPRCWMQAIAGSNPADNSLYLNLDTEKLELLNFNGGKLRFYNCFGFKNEDELVYFTSLTVQELQLKASNITLILSGDVELNDKNYNRLAEFFGKVELNNLKTVHFPPKVAAHNVLNLTALALCGSSAAR
jgi:hypothetical protein